MLLDVAYQHGPFDENPELRYSLRSLVNLPHGKVVIAGHLPPWVDRAFVTHLPVAQRPGLKHENALANLRAIARAYTLTDDVVVLNDDHYVTQPLERVPLLHRGPLAQAVEDRFATMPDRHAQSMLHTLLLLQRLGISEPLCYDLHAPGVVNRVKLDQTLSLICSEAAGLDAPRILWRTVYGNLHTCGGTAWHDVKVRDRLTDDLTGPFVSTDDVTWQCGAIGAALRSAFPAQCRYERHNGKARP